MIYLKEKLERRYIMPDIKPISDLRNYSSVINEVTYGHPVYLTRNGRGAIAMVNIQEYDEMEKQLSIYRIQNEMKKGEDSIKEKGTVSADELFKELGV